MKQRILALLMVLCVLFTATGCSSMFDRTVSSVTRHQEQSASKEDGSALHAENYADLVSCVQHFVFMGQYEGKVRVYKYSGDIEADLRAACREVLTEDPLGAYALSDISFDYDRIVSYYECTFHFLFRRSKAEIASIVNAYGNVSIRSEIAKAMSNFKTSLTFRTASFYADRTSLYNLAQEAYYSSPRTALGYPAINITIYPDTGDIRIVEMHFTYSQSPDAMKKQEDEVAEAAAIMVGQDAAANGDVADLLYSRLLSEMDYAPDGSSSIYGALCEGSCNSEGAALAYQLVCQQAGIPCLLVRGIHNGAPHFWNMVKLDDIWWHVDVSRKAPVENYLRTDKYLESNGYHWSSTDFPASNGETAAEE